MKNGVYNKGVYFPFELVQQVDNIVSTQFKILPTYHYAKKAAQLNLPYNCYKAMLYGEIVEVEYNNGVKKIVTRLPHRYDENLDICAAIMLNGAEAEAVVKTVWVNNHNDNHATINKSNYICCYEVG